MFESISLSDISEKNCRIIRKPTSTRPVVWHIEDNGHKAIVKDFRLNGFLFRNTVGRFLIWREAKAYRNVKGLKGIPLLHRSLNGIALIIEEIQGKDLAEINVSEHSDDFYKDLRLLINQIHERGMAHCDLKRASNIIMGNDRKPYIIDWAASISRHEFRFFPLNRLYERFVQDDLNAVTKFKLKFCPENVTPEEKSSCLERTRAEIVIRRIRERLRGILQKIA